MKTELGSTIEGIAMHHLLIIGELHRWSDNESVPGHIVREALVKLVEGHTALGTLVPVAERIDGLLSALTEKAEGKAQDGSESLAG